MNILTFDIEDWYNCDFLSGNFEWDGLEYRVERALRPLLDELDRRQLKGTFFCLGWLAERHPELIREIDRRGHQLGCHSYQHELATRFTPEQFAADTRRAKELIEQAAGRAVECFRAPGFSLTEGNTWAVDCLAELGFRFDSSVFPAHHDYGGMPRYGEGRPALLRTAAGSTLKEFPVSIHRLAGHPLVFSGGGFFRFFPYGLIRRWGRQADYLMTYFHPRDFDVGQPVVQGLPPRRRFKSYVGIRGCFDKWRRLLDDFDFVSIAQADRLVDWRRADIVQL